MKKSKLLVGVLCISIGIFLTGCNNQTAVSSIRSESAPSESISLPDVQSSNPERNSKKVILYAYDGTGSSPTGHKLIQQMPQDVKEIQETVKIPSNEATPDKIMKLYTEKFLSEPVGNGTMNFSYSSATMSGDGTITIDFTKEGAHYLSYGITMETNILYGIGKTMLMNVEGAKAVFYGIEGGNYSTERFLDRSTPYLTK